MTANVAISLGWNAIDAQVELGGAGIPDDGADEMLAALGHAPGIRCICRMIAADRDEAAA